MIFNNYVFPPFQIYSLLPPPLIPPPIWYYLLVPLMLFLLNNHKRVFYFVFIASLILWLFLAGILFAKEGYNKFFKILAIFYFLVLNFLIMLI